MINRIQIENFKSIQKMDLELRPINVLIGANGVGKSNFIQFFKLLKNIYDRNLQRYVLEEGGSDNLLHCGLKYSDYLKGRIEFDNRNAYSLEIGSDVENNLFIQVDYAEFYPDFYQFWEKKEATTNKYESSLKSIYGGTYYWVKKHLESFKIL